MMSKLLAIASGLVALSGTVADGQTETDLVYANDRELGHWRLLNQMRAKGITCPDGEKFAPNDQWLLFDCRLWRAARLHSEDMKAKKYFSHKNKEGEYPNDRAKKQGIASAGENITKGTNDPKAALMSFRKSSSGHCNQMMNADKLMIGIGQAGLYYTQLFADGQQYVDTWDSSCIPPRTENTPEPTSYPTPLPTAPTLEPTAEPTPAPGPPSWAPTPEVMFICQPNAECRASDECYQRLVGKCFIGGTAKCGAPEDVFNDPDWQNCEGVAAVSVELEQFCAPHPDDANATWEKCFRTTHINASQCQAQGDSEGVQCHWIFAKQRS